MYENPQYLTPDGYRRMSKNPVKPVARDPNTALALIRKKKSDLLPKRSFSESPSGKKPVLSEEAAKAIAAAISGMLRK
ncbi:MAG: hypothetical protein JXA71_12455 [Chitinispirillaceae bacterium]|nr:hypothetical protein [Chitinispirillaceae bacterium]